MKRFKAKGFTLIELVIYIGILSILLSVMSSMFGTIADVQLESNATSSVDQDGRYILAKFLHDFQANTPVVINTPALPGVSANNVVITVNGEPTSYTYSVDGNANLLLSNSLGLNQINSFDTAVSSFSATKLGSGDSNDTVRVSFTLTSRTRERSGYESKTFTSTFAGHN